MKLKIFYHVVDLPGWQDIVDEQLGCMKYSGLLDSAELRIYCHYDSTSFDNLKERYQQYNNINWIFPVCDRRDLEFPTLLDLHRLSAEEDFYALYLHLKGITYIGSAEEVPTRHWRWLMNYWNITQWRKCLSKLEEGYDAVGCQIHPYIYPRHFSGNFHWARSDFIRRCNQLSLPHTRDFVAQIPHGGKYALDAEFWYGYNNANMYSLYDNHINHYEQELPPEVYRLE